MTLHGPLANVTSTVVVNHDRGSGSFYLDELRRLLAGVNIYSGVSASATTDVFNLTPPKVEIIPVKYSAWELRRWATILQRFAVSAGNTIGIVNARVHWNQQGGFYPQLFLNGLSSANDSPADRRETIEVWTRGDQQVVADALPVLLPLLGIPVDAVGVVRRR